MNKQLDSLVYYFAYPSKSLSITLAFKYHNDKIMKLLFVRNKCRMGV